VDIVKQYPKDKEYRRFKVSPQAVRKIGEHAKGKGLGPDDLIFELRQDFDARPRLAVVPDPAAPGKTKGPQLRPRDAERLLSRPAPLRALPSGLRSVPARALGDNLQDY
jgi:hypothetical protein